MKKIMLTGIAVLLAASLAACMTVKEQEESVPEPSADEPGVSQPEESIPLPPDPATPQGAVEELFESIRTWDTAAVEVYLPPDASVDQYVPPALQHSVSKAMERMEYEIVQVTAVEDEAAVEMEITAVDVEGAINDAIGAAVAYVAKQQISGNGVESYTDVAQAITESIDIDALPTKTTDATAYMVRGGDDLWKLNLSDQRNMPLLNAVSGGSVELALRVQELAETYGLSLK